MTLANDKIYDSVIWWPLAIGLGIALFFALPFDPLWWVGIVACAVIVPFFYLTSYPWHRVPLLILMAAIGFTMAGLRVEWVDAPRWDGDKKPVEMTATVAEVTAMPVGTRLLLSDVAVENGTILKKARLVCRACTIDSAPVGAMVRLRGSLTPPAGPARAGGFDFRRVAYFRQIGAVGFSFGVPEIMTPAKEGFTGFQAARQRLAAIVEAHVPDKDTRGLAIALLTGVSSGLPEDLREAYQASGLAHIYSVSGLHLSFVAGFLFYLFRGCFALTPFALRWPTKKIAAFMALIAIILFTLFAGDSVPTWRSLLMAGTVLLAVMTDRFAFTLRTVALAACAVLIVLPEMLLDISFQLSFAAVTALVAWMEWVQRKWNHHAVAWPVRTLRDVLITSLLATFATLPFILHSFGRLSVWAPLANLIGIPWTGFVIMPLVLLTLVAFPFGLAAPVLVLLSPALNVLNEWAYIVAGWEYSDLRVPTIPMACVTICALSLYLACAHPRRWSFGVLLLSYLFLGGMAALPPAPPPVAYVSDEGLIAIHDGDQMWVSSSTKAKFVRTQWANEWGLNDAQINTLPREGAVGTIGFCDRGQCRLRTSDGVSIRIIRSAIGAGEACHSGDIVIAPTVRLPSTCPNGVGKNDLYQYGVHALQNGNLRPIMDAAVNRVWMR